MHAVVIVPPAASLNMHPQCTCAAPHIYLSSIAHFSFDLIQQQQYTYIPIYYYYLLSFHLLFFCLSWPVSNSLFLACQLSLDMNDSQIRCRRHQSKSERRWRRRAVMYVLLLRWWQSQIFVKTFFSLWLAG